MTDICKNCPNLETCIENNISPQECEELNFSDPDFVELYNKKKWGEYGWGEMSYNRFTEDELDYGDLSDLEEEEI